jgi:hypothetical protein
MKEFLSGDSNQNQSTTSAPNDDESLVGRRVGAYRIERDLLGR